MAKMASMILAVCLLSIVAVASETNFTSNEIAVIQEIIKIRSAQTDYHANSSIHTFARSLVELNSGDKTKGLSLISDELSTGRLHGYLFEMEASDLDNSEKEVQRWRSWSLKVKPEKYDASGQKSFFCDQTGIIRAADNRGVWGSAEMPQVAEAEIARIIPKVTFPTTTISEGKIPERKEQDQIVEHENEAASSYKSQKDGSVISYVIKESIDNEGNRKWRLSGIPQNGNLWQKTNDVWKEQSESFLAEMEVNLASKKLGSINGQFCYAIQRNKCEPFDLSNAKVFLFPADPQVMQRLSAIFSPDYPMDRGIRQRIEDVFSDYKNTGKVNNLVRETRCNPEDGSFCFDNVPIGEWIVYGYLECPISLSETNELTPVSLEYCDVWIDFINVRSDQKAQLEKFYFGTRANGIVNTIPSIE